MGPGRRDSRPPQRIGRDRGGPPRGGGLAPRAPIVAPSIPTGHELLHGPNVVLEALGGRRRIYRVLLAEGNRGERAEAIRRRAESRNIPVRVHPRAVLDALTPHHQGVIAEVSPYAYGDFGELLAGLDMESAPMLLVLDSIQDPQNVGSLIRTAAAAGVAGVVLPDRRACEVTPTVVRASAGLAERVNVVQVGNLARAIQDLKRRGFWTVGLAAEAPRAAYDANLRGSVAIVVGGEGMGIRQLVGRTCDELVSVPMAAGVESLNAAIAGAIALFEAVRQRDKDNGPDRSGPVAEEARFELAAQE